MDVNFFNPFTFPLEMCWVALEGGVAPVCYGSAAPQATKNMSSYAGHHFVSKRLIWTATQGGAKQRVAGESAAEPRSSSGLLSINSRLEAYSWDHRWFQPSAEGAPPPARLRVRNPLPFPVEVCTGVQCAA